MFPAIETQRFYSLVSIIHNNNRTSGRRVMLSAFEAALL
jgi:hypothetical protein